VTMRAVGRRALGMTTALGMMRSTRPDSQGS
jgi:hypothetical protein